MNDETQISLMSQMPLIASSPGAELGSISVHQRHLRQVVLSRQGSLLSGTT